MPNIVPPIITAKKRKHVLESKVETYYKEQIAKRGGVSWKFTSPNRRSVTDQVTLFHGRVIFAEMKAYGKKLTPKQETFRLTVLEHGGEHVTISGRGGVDDFIKKLEKELTWWQKIWQIYSLMIRKFDGSYESTFVPKKRKRKNGQ